MATALFWYARRLAAMSPAEVAHRVVEAARRRRGRRLRVAAPVDPMRFRPWPVDAARLAAIAGQSAPHWRQEIARARRGDWRALGRRWPQVPLGALWHLDPVTGKSWEARRYAFDIPYRHRRDMGDIKYCWEVNRLQILPLVAALWRIETEAGAEGAEAHLRFCMELVESWLDTNPPFRGINWNSGIECALRAVSLLAMLSLLGPERLPHALRRRVWESLSAHATWIARSPRAIPRPTTTGSPSWRRWCCSATRCPICRVPERPAMRRRRSFGRKCWRRSIPTAWAPSNRPAIPVSRWNGCCWRAVLRPSRPRSARG
jgi:hypothetical protein